MQIRKLRPEDTEAYFALRQLGLVTDPQSFLPCPDEERLEDMAVRLQPSDDSGVFGAFVDGTLAGLTGVVRDRRRKLAHKAMIVGVYVHPDHRGKGIARSLLQAALDMLAAHPDILQVHLGVNPANTVALALYEQAGFTAYGREPGALRIGDTLHDEILMARRMHDAPRPQDD